MLTVSGGQPPYDWSVIAGSLPDGIEFNTASASISGTPTLASTGTYVFTVQVTDIDDPPNTDIQHLQLSIPYCQDSDGDDFGDPEQTANTCPTDNCPDIYNPLQEDIDGDGIGDSCEVIRSWLVSADASGDAPTIQAAIDSCTNGDTVVIGDGYFTGVGNSDFLLGGRQILIMSQNGANNTIIYCGGSPTSPQRAFEFVSGEDSNCVIRGLTIKGGYGPEASGTSSGGAVYLENSSPTFADCIFEYNAAALGGAVFCRNADPTFIGCSFLANSASMGSAILGIDNSQITLERCLISLNEESQPVGCVNGGTVTAARCNVFGNEAGDWNGCLAELYPGYGNLCYDPLFCSESADPLTVDALSPCLPEQNSLQQRIGANQEGCRHWQMVSEVHVSDKLHAGIRPVLGKKNTGNTDTVPGPSLYRYLTATFLSSVSIQSGDQATVYLAQDSEEIFETGVLREAVVISASGEPTRQAVVEVKLEEGDAEYYPHLGLEAIGEWNLLDESRQVIDYLTLDPGTTGATERQPLAAGTEVPDEFALFVNYPNPFNASTVIQFALPHEQQVEIAIYDILGRKIKALTNETFPAGMHTITWHGTGDRNTPAPSGLYFCKLISRDHQATMKMVLMK